MKKILCVLCAAAMVLACAGCNNNAPAAETTTAAPEVTTTAPERTSAAITTTAPEAEETTSEATTDAPASAGTAPDGIDAAIYGGDTAETAPAAIGQWVKATRYAVRDKTYRTIYVRVTSVTTDSDDLDYVNAAIELNNSFAPDYKKIDRAEYNLPDDVEFGVLTYEVYVPADFPSADYGIITPDVDFSEGNIGGGGFPSADGASVYIGLGTNTVDLETAADEPSYMPGNTYQFTCLFTMVKGYEDYFLSFTSYLEGTTDISSDVSFVSYFDHK